MVSTDIMPPRLQPAGDAVQHPEPRFRFRFARVTKDRLPSLVKRHALGNELVPTKQSVNELAGLAVLLKTIAVTARLMIEHDHLGAAADLPVIAEALDRKSTRLN